MYTSTGSQLLAALRVERAHTAPETARVLYLRWMSDVSYELDAATPETEPVLLHTHRVLHHLIGA